MLEAPRDIPQNEWRWPHFSRDELKCKLTGECRMDTAFLDTMEHVRRNFGFPIIVSSGYRSPEHNKQVSKTGDSGPHTTGRALDIAIRGEDAYVLLKIVLAYGMTGIGINQRGDARFLHIDNLEKPDFPRPMIWSY